LRVESLATELVALEDIEGITFSGGEPMSQAAALVHLIDTVRQVRDLTFMSYSGYTLQFLRDRGTREQKSLIERLDILVDGLYVAARHTNLRWRGSDNQHVHFLSSRYAHLRTTVDDRGHWIEFEHTAGGNVHWMGIPPRGFREAFERGMQQRGIGLNCNGDGS
jgi:anaerobic ribonucleoside-triphosphate reductase activating protein